MYHIFFINSSVDVKASLIKAGECLEFPKTTQGGVIESHSLFLTMTKGERYHCYPHIKIEDSAQQSVVNPP